MTPLTWFLRPGKAKQHCPEIYIVDLGALPTFSTSDATEIEQISRNQQKIKCSSDLLVLTLVLSAPLRQSSHRHREKERFPGKKRKASLKLLSSTLKAEHRVHQRPELVVRTDPEKASMDPGRGSGSDWGLLPPDPAVGLGIVRAQPRPHPPTHLHS